MEAGFIIDFRIPSDAAEDGFAHMPFYGGTIVTPAPSSVIVMEYKHSPWRLPLPHAQIRTYKDIQIYTCRYTDIHKYYFVTNKNMYNNTHTDTPTYTYADTRT